MNVLDLVGNTPLVELKNILPQDAQVRIFAKAEYLNASGSVKDRAALSMIRSGLKTGALTQGKTIVDSTSGNTGIAYAMIGAALGYKVILFMPANVTTERKRVMKAYGATVIETPALEGMEGAYLRCKQLVESKPEEYFYPDQFTNDANWQAHYLCTGEEIWRQTSGLVTHFIAGTGTSGTFMGCTRRLKEHDPKIKCITVSPDLPFHGIEGIKHFSKLNTNGFFRKEESDGKIEVSTEEAYKMTRKLSNQEGVFVGISSGANVTAAVRVAQTAPAGSVIVTVLCDNGCRYLTSHVWS